ncbi:MAG TPA: biotin/lipoyl-containing protein, partial [Kofleriaceae bacterium]|nr:biotin/lipoyl-containing protein [Kofleriaceae bacterium]
AAVDIGFPVLLKASAGGGGKGMRVVRRADELDDAIDGARREALSSFGDATLLVERYVDRPRHVEIQILGDAHGNLVHLFERECSIQRRHQKIIEESPSPALDAELRGRMGAAAVAVGRAVGYQNAGTVEMILGEGGSFYFLEVNTRLQVEHPGTELVTGIDLVREQIRIAEGAPLPFTQEELGQRGHAIEVRLYAEDADGGFLPTTGRLLAWDVPADAGLRADAGVEAGSEVGIHYDPMLAKVIAHAPTRAEAARALATGLRRLWAPGLVTNRDYLVRLLEHPAFVAGELDTHFIERHAAALAPAAPDAEALATAATAAALHAAARRRAARALLPALEPGYRNNRFADEEVGYAVGNETITVRYRNLGGDRYQIAAGPLAGIGRVSATADRIALELDGRCTTFRVACDGPRCYLQTSRATFALDEQPRFPERRAAAVAGACAAPMPGKVVKVLVAVGQTVSAGDTLLVLEAMKMEHTVRAPEAGIVERLAVAEGDQVAAAALLVVVTPAA